jgi:hypothetical protein
MATENNIRTTQEFDEENYFKKVLAMLGDEELAREYVRRTAPMRRSSAAPGASIILPNAAITLPIETSADLSQPSQQLDCVRDTLASEQEDAERAGAVGYMARALIQATMPHSKPKETYFKRKNGIYTLFMQANQEIGLPYGAIPRLLIAWMTQEAVVRKSRELLLGDSLSAFMRVLGFTPSGGKKGTIPALKEQMRRLFTTMIGCSYSDDGRDVGLQMLLVDSYDLWWHPKNPDQQSFWQSTITLSEHFFQEIAASPIPVRMSTMEALRGSSMALDIYFWLTYKNFYSKRPSRIPWEALQAQFGAGYPDTPQGKRNFKKKFLLALQKVGTVYPEAQKLQAEADVLVYVPGFPDVSPLVPKET